MILEAEILMELGLGAESENSGDLNRRATPGCGSGAAAWLWLKGSKKSESERAGASIIKGKQNEVTKR